MLKRILTGALFLMLAFAASVQGQVTGTRPGFSQGMLTVGRNADSLYVFPPVRGLAGQTPLLSSDAVNMEWGTASASGDTVILGSDTIFVASVASDTARQVQSEIIYYDFSIADSSVDIKEGINGAWAKAGEALVFGDVVYFASDSTWKKADADTTGTEFVKRAMGFVTADISNGSTGVIMTRGAAKAVGWNWTNIGRDLYLSTTAGAMTQSPDTSAGNAVQIIGWSPHPDFIILQFNQPWARK